MFQRWVVEIWRVIIFLFAIFTLIPNQLKSVPVILLGIVAIFTVLSDKHGSISELSKDKGKVLMQMTPLLILIPSVFYSENLQAYWSLVTRALSFFVIPLAFWVGKKFITVENRIMWQKVFLLSNFLFGLFFIWTEIINVPGDFSQILKDVNSLRDGINNFPYIGTHPIYFSNFMGLSLIICLVNEINLKFFGRILFGGVIAFCLVILASKTALISMLLILMALFYWKLRLFKNNPKKLLWVGLIGFLIFLSFSNFERRFREVWSKNTYTEVSIHNSTSIRFGILNCSINKVSEFGLLGCGIGDVQDQLNLCYSLNSPVLLKGNYNCHNQYFSYLIGTGILGLGVFLWFLFINVRSSFSKEDLLFFLGLLFFIVGFLTENILERRSGLILFAFFVNYFYWFSVSNPNEIE